MADAKVIKKTRTWLDQDVPLAYNEDGTVKPDTLTTVIPDTGDRADECPQCGATTEPVPGPRYLTPDGFGPTRYYLTKDKNGPVGEMWLYSCTCPDSIEWFVNWVEVS